MKPITITITETNDRQRRLYGAVSGVRAGYYMANIKCGSKAIRLFSDEDSRKSWLIDEDKPIYLLTQMQNVMHKCEPCVMSIADGRTAT